MRKTMKEVDSKEILNIGKRIAKNELTHVQFQWWLDQWEMTLDEFTKRFHKELNKVFRKLILEFFWWWATFVFLMMLVGNLIKGR